MFRGTQRTIDTQSKHYGGLERLGLEDLLVLTRQRSEILTGACESVGRDPARSDDRLLLPNSAVDPWGDPGPLRRLIDALREMEFDEVIFYSRRRTVDPSLSARCWSCSPSFADLAAGSLGGPSAPAV